MTDLLRRILNIPNLIATQYAIDLDEFTQSCGSELLTNPGNPFTFTGDDPDGWTVTGESGSDPMVTEVAPDGGAGTGAIRFYSSATTSNPRLSQNDVFSGAGIYQSFVDVSHYVSGKLRFQEAGNANYRYDITTTIMIRVIGRAGGVSDDFILLGSDATPYDYVIRECSLKRVTLNAQQVAPVNQRAIHTFTLPGSPVSGDTEMVLYRIDGVGEELNNCWKAAVTYDGSAWKAKLSYFINGTETTVTNPTLSITPNAIKVEVFNDEHVMWVSDDGGTTWEYAGVATSSQHNAAMGLNTLYTCGQVTPLRLTSQELTALDDASDFDLLYTTTAINQTATINKAQASQPIVIDWGDGSATYVAAGSTGTHTHQYATIGSYAVSIRGSQYLTDLRIFSDTKWSGSITNWDVGNFANLRLFSTLITGDISSFVTSEISYLHLGYTTILGEVSELDLSSCNYVYLMSTNVSFSAVNLTLTQNINSQAVDLSGCSLTTAEVDNIINSIWANRLTRTATGGTINLGGTNAAPTGTVQAPSGAVANPGEMAYELVNDSLGEGFNVWSTVTVTT